MTGWSRPGRSSFANKKQGCTCFYIEITILSYSPNRLLTSRHACFLMVSAFCGEQMRVSDQLCRLSVFCLEPWFLSAGSLVELGGPWWCVLPLVSIELSSVEIRVGLFHPTPSTKRILVITKGPARKNAAIYTPKKISVDTLAV